MALSLIEPVLRALLIAATVTGAVAVKLAGVMQGVGQDALATVAIYTLAALLAALASLRIAGKRLRTAPAAVPVAVPSNRIRWRLVRLRGRVASSVSAACRHITGALSAVCRHIAGSVFAVCRLIAGSVFAVCRLIAGSVFALCRHIAGSVFALCRHIAGLVSAICRHIAGLVSALCRNIAGSVFAAGRHIAGAGSAAWRSIGAATGWFGAGMAEQFRTARGFVQYRLWPAARGAVVRFADILSGKFLPAAWDAASGTARLLFLRVMPAIWDHVIRPASIAAYQFLAAARVGVVRLAEAAMARLRGRHAPPLPPAHVERSRVPAPRPRLSEDEVLRAIREKIEGLAAESRARRGAALADGTPEVSR
jgi:hypothetical protein